MAWCNPRHALGFKPMNASTTSFRWVSSALVMACAALLLLSGCGAPDDLPAPGADGLVVVHWWDEKKPGPPAYLQAEKVAQGDAEFGKLEFSRVMMRLPGEQGVAYIVAPWARYDRGQADAIVMESEKERPMDGPVRFFGVWNEDVFIGRADRAVFEEAKHRMRLDQVEINVSGNRHRTAWAALSQDQPPAFGALAPLPAAPSITAALAALPVPLVLPPMRQ